MEEIVCEQKYDENFDETDARVLIKLGSIYNKLSKYTEAIKYSVKCK